MENTNRLFSELAKYRMIKEETESEIKRLETAIKDIMAARGVNEIVGNEHKATISSFQKLTFDSKLFKIEEPELYGIYSKQVQQSRFIFK